MTRTPSSAPIAHPPDVRGSRRDLGPTGAPIIALLDARQRRGDTALIRPACSRSLIRRATLPDASRGMAPVEAQVLEDGSTVEARTDHPPLSRASVGSWLARPA